MASAEGEVFPKAELSGSAANAHCDLEFAHVLFTDLVGYSMLPMEQQRAHLGELQQIVHDTPRYREAEAAGELVSLPTGDGMALVFFRDPSAPAQCATEIAAGLKSRTHLKLRMGINSGPVYRVTDVNAHHNVAGGGINMAQRVMDCGDAGHILVSQSSAEVLRQMGQWSPHLTDLGECTVKHGVRVRIYNLAGGNFGNTVRPKKVGRTAVTPLPTRRFMASAAGLGITAAAAAAGGAYWMFRRQMAGLEAQGPSIAVLPFADLSPGKDQAYFSDGLAEEVLDGLSKIPGLRVVGRASAFQFRDRTEDFQMIAEKLHVATILEGSVRRQDNRARISVQLLKAADGQRMWSETFEKDLRDILAVEEDIARAVTGALKVELLGRTTSAAAPSNMNPDAYNAYLQGRYFYERPDRDNLERAAAYFEQAVKLQPDYAAAWLGLGEARISQADGAYVNVGEGYQAGRNAIQKALSLNDNLAEAHAALGWLEISQSFDWNGAEAPIKRALELEPNNAQVIRYAARLARARGRHAEAIALNQRGINVDPLSSRIYHNLGWAFYYAGRQKEAAAAIQKALELNPAMSNAHLSLAKVLLAEGRNPAALAEALKEKHPAYGLLALVLAYHAVGSKKESDAALNQLVAKYSLEDAYQIAEAYAFRGEADRAFEWLERARAQRDPGFSEMKGDPLLKNLEGDPRYAAFLMKMGL